MRASWLVGLAIVAMAIVIAACDDAQEDLPGDADTSPTPAAEVDPNAATVVPDNTPAPSPSLEPSLTPGAGVTRWRWGNTTILVPDDQGFFVHGTSSSPAEKPPNGGLILEIRLGESEVVVDAETATVLREYVFDADRSALESSLSTLAYSDSAYERELGWPYDPKEPSGEKTQKDNIRYWEPHPSSGIEAVYGCGIGTGGEEGCFVRISNGRSWLGVGSHSGKVIAEASNVSLGDADAFARWTASVEQLVE